MSKEYFNNFSSFSVLGVIIKNPELLEKVDLKADDFGIPIYQTIYNAINNIYANGGTHINQLSIDAYLSEYPNQYRIWNEEQGLSLVSSMINKANPTMFEFYYKDVKKRSLLQTLSKIIDLDWIYDADAIDPKRIELQNKWLEQTSLNGIMSEVDARIDQMRGEYFSVANNTADLVGDGVYELIEELKKTPAIGAPFAMGGEINSLTRGMIPGKFYLRSAMSGYGKSRTMAGDLCYNACSEIYDTEKNEWVSTGVQIACSLITTELGLDEIQTMSLAYLSGVPEKHILHGKYLTGEEERVKYAAKLLQEAKMYITMLPEYDADDIEIIIRRTIREHDVQIVFMDYIHSSQKLLETLSQKARGVSLREDQMLYLISVKLKEFANQYQVAMVSSTQLNGSAYEEKVPSANALAGAKAIAQKIDVGMIMMPIREFEEEAIYTIVAETGCAMPDASMTFYKNRRGEKARVWYKSDYGTCRFTPIFATNERNEIIRVDRLEIMMMEPAPSPTQPEELAFTIDENGEIIF